MQHISSDIASLQVKLKLTPKNDNWTGVISIHDYNQWLKNKRITL